MFEQIWQMDRYPSANDETHTCVDLYGALVSSRINR
jgi:hypothetical protein